MTPQYLQVTHTRGPGTTNETDFRAEGGGLGPLPLKPSVLAFQTPFSESGPTFLSDSVTAVPKENGEPT